MVLTDCDAIPRNEKKRRRRRLLCSAAPADEAGDGYRVLISSLFESVPNWPASNKLAAPPSLLVILYASPSSAQLRRPRCGARLGGSQGGKTWRPSMRPLFLLPSIQPPVVVTDAPHLLTDVVDVGVHSEADSHHQDGQEEQGEPDDAEDERQARPLPFLASSSPDSSAFVPAFAPARCNIKQKGKEKERNDVTTRCCFSFPLARSLFAPMTRHAHSNSKEHFH